MKNHLQHLPGLARPFKMIAVKGGQFDMGGESWDTDSLPVHRVLLTDFMIGEFPVTQELWMTVTQTSENPAFFKGMNRPVENVSWNDINEQFLSGLNQLTRNSRPSGLIFRLATEAEWEYAARGGFEHAPAGLPFSGSALIDEVGWCDENSHGETKAVGLKLPNALGLYDMTGNVWEWCYDWYDGEYYEKCKKEGVIENPTGLKEGGFRVLRGGSWRTDAGNCRVARRGSNWPTDRDNYYGFRLALGSPLPV